MSNNINTCGWCGLCVENEFFGYCRIDRLIVDSNRPACSYFIDEEDFFILDPATQLAHVAKIKTDIENMCDELGI